LTADLARAMERREERQAVMDFNQGLLDRAVEQDA
jgi:hypothetical protein